MAVLDYGDNVHKETAIASDSKVFAGNGQGCQTIWYRTVADARRAIKKNGDVIPNGTNSGLCKTCRCYFHYGSKEWKKATEYACKNYKANIAGCSQD